MIKVKVTIARTNNGEIAAITAEKPLFMFVHSDIKALAQMVDNTLRSYEEFHEEMGVRYEPDYYFTQDIVHWSAL